MIGMESSYLCDLDVLFQGGFVSTRDPCKLVVHGSRVLVKRILNTAQISTYNMCPSVLGITPLSGCVGVIYNLFLGLQGEVCQRLCSLANTASYGDVHVLLLRFPQRRPILMPEIINLMRRGGIMSPSYLTVKQFSERYNISTSLAYRLIQSGEVEAIRIGRKNYRIPLTGVHFVQGRKVLP